jgi:hypothetical protein
MSAELVRASFSFRAGETTLRSRWRLKSAGASGPGALHGGTVAAHGQARLGSESRFCPGWSPR